MDTLFSNCIKVVVSWIKRWARYRKMMKFSKMTVIKIGKIKNE